MKILHLIDSGGLYGAEMVLLNLAARQNAEGMQATILSMGLPGEGQKPLEQAAKARGVPVIAWRAKAGLNLLAAWRIVRYARQQGVTLLHSHGYKFNILLGLLPAVARRLPCVATLHGYVGAGRYSALWWYQRIERRLLPRLNGIVFVSEATRRKPLLRGMRVKHEAVIRNGIDVAAVREQSAGGRALLQSWFADVAEPLCLCAVGRLSPEKGFDVLIGAFAELFPSWPRLRLVIIGDGPLREQLEQQIASLGLQDVVKLPGYIQPASKVMAASEAVVMPSLSEGLPISLLEACALGRPVVASAVGGIPEVLHCYPQGRCVEPGNKQALMAAIEERVLRGDEDHSAVQSWSVRDYSVAGMSQHYAGFYRRVCGSET